MNLPNKNLFIFLALALTAGFLLFSQATLVQAVDPGPQQGANINTAATGIQYAGQIGLGSQDIRTTIASIIRTAIGLLGIVVIVLMIYAGFLWMTAGGNEDKIVQAKKILINSVIGLAIILSAYAITSFIISKLVEATQSVPLHCTNDVWDKDMGEEALNCGGECPPCNAQCPDCFLPNNVFFINSMFRGGDVCVRNFHPTIIFSKDVKLDTVGNIFTIVKKSDSSLANGTWQLAKNDQNQDIKNMIVFVPDGDCGNGQAGCLEPRVTYILTIDKTKVSQVKSLDNLSLSCDFNGDRCQNIEFTTGENIDITPPVISINSPIGVVEAGEVVPVRIGFDDDSGVQNVSLYDGARYVGSALPAENCQKVGEVEINWPTAGQSLGNHLLESLGLDWGGHIGRDSEIIAIRPQHCFDEELQEGEEEKGPPACGGECGACANGACEKNSDCASGFCENGRCLDKIKILGFGPKSGAPNTFVTIYGYYFGDQAGRVYFTATDKPQPDVNNDADWIEAELADCGVAPMWTNRQITVKLPQPVAGGKQAVDGPIKVVTALVNGKSFTDTTNDDWGPNAGIFDVNTQVRPKLCSVAPNHGAAGNAVVLGGRDWGNYNVQDSKILFGETVGTTKAEDWQAESIRTAVPVGLETGSLVVKVMAKIGNQAVESNGLFFQIDSGVSADLPVISGIAPDRGGDGQYITISGKNFGKEAGTVWFKLSGQGEAQPGDMNFPDDCTGHLWSDEQVIVKFPAGKEPGNYSVQIRRADNQVSPIFNAFKALGGQADPGICRLSPSSGPIPLPQGIKLEIVGEYFQTPEKANPEVYFSKAGAKANNVATMSLAAFDSLVDLNPGQKVFAIPADNTVSGDVVLRRLRDNKLSNTLNFKVANCTKEKDVCQGGDKCCGDGTCRAACPGARVAAGYVWRFSTRDIPDLPRVLEECSDVRVNGILPIPSPSPSVQWDEGGKEDHQNVCNTALVTVKFNTAISQASINDNVIVRSCGSVDENNCIDPGANLELTPESLQLKVAAADNKGIQTNYLLLEPQNGSWPINTWYQVVLTQGITTDKDTLGAVRPYDLSADRPCGVENSAYCFVFRTDDKDCELSQVLISPERFLTNTLTGEENPIRYREKGAERDLVYEGHGLSKQHCIMMSMRGYNWKWRTLINNGNVDNTYARIFKGIDNQSTAKVSALENTMGVNLHDPADASNVEGRALKADVNMPGTSPLTIDLSNPKIVDYWPKCQETCTDAKVGVRFNMNISTRNLSPGEALNGAAQLWKCDDDNCLNPTAVALNNIVPPENGVGNISREIGIFNSGPVVTQLDPDSLYKVVVSHIANASKQVWSLRSTVDMSSWRKPLAEEFTWRFKTKKEPCLIDRIAVDPLEYVAQRLNDRVIFSGEAYSSPDSCDPKGQKLNPWDISWNWITTHPLVASVHTFRTTRVPNQYCTATCVRKGSNLSKGANVPLCGNGRVEAGEDCDPPNKAGGCSLNCLRLGNNNPALAVGAVDDGLCGDGFVNPQVGEECDKGAQPIGCSDKCLRTGSQPPEKIEASAVNASVCGNGRVTLGEDCDIGITALFTDPTTALGCSANCLHLGSKIAKLWCGAAADHGGYEAADYKDLCSQSLSQCGDGIQDQDEDPGCETGVVGTINPNCTDFCTLKENEGCDANTEGCSASGTWLGSSLMYTVPSVCGDGLPAGIGEDPFCETGLNIVDKINPKVLTIGEGRGLEADLDRSQQPPRQISDIRATVNGNNVNRGAATASGQFIIPCGYKSDSDCKAFDPESSLGRDSCCYKTPRLVSVYPVTTTDPNIVDNVCPNTYLEAVFDQPIDEQTLSGNFVIAKGIQNHADGSVRGGPIGKMAIVGNTLFATVNNNSLQSFDISNPSSPQLLDTLLNSPPDVSIANPRSLVVDDRYAYVLTDVFLDIVDISTPNNLTNRKATQMIYRANDNGLARLFRLFNKDNKKYAFILSGEDGNADQGRLYALEIIDPMRVATFEVVANNQNGFLLNDPLSAEIAGNYLFVGLGTGILEVIDITDPRHLSHVGNINLSGAINSITITGKYLFAVSNDRQIFSIVDISNPPDPQLVGTVNNPILGSVSDISVNGQIAYLATHSADENAGSVARIRISSSTHPVFMNNLGRGSSSFGGINSVKFYNDYVISGSRDAIAFTYTYTLCEGMEDVTSLIVEAINSQYRPWYAKVWNYVITWIHDFVSGEAAAGNRAVRSFRWCAGDDLGVAKVVNDPVQKLSHVTVQLDNPLTGNTEYAIILKAGVRDLRGISIGTKNNKAINWKFATQSDLCAISSVEVDPNQYLFRRANTNIDLRAGAKDIEGRSIQPTLVYDWDYIWSPINNGIVSWVATSSSINNVKTENRNGEVTVRVSANVKPNAVGEPRGQVATAESKLTVNLCENPWPPVDLLVNAQPVIISPYEDKEGNNDYFNLSSNVFTGAEATDIRSGAKYYFNFSTFYCADNGVEGAFDDFPYLRPAIQTSASALGGEPTKKCEHDETIDCTNNNDCRHVNAQHEEVPGVCREVGGVFTKGLKRFIFTNDRNNDAIGIQIFANTGHKSLSDWLVEQNLAGNFQPTKFGSYEAVRDNNNLYINALNTNSSGRIYTNVYLFSINSDAQPETRKVFEQILANLKLNINLTNKEYCGGNSEISCKKDFDCPSGQTCLADIDKMLNNVQRIKDLKKLGGMLADFNSQGVATPYPSLTEGSYLPGQSVSTWPSWAAALGNELGQNPPADPINTLGISGTCAAKAGASAFCANDSYCSGFAPTSTCNFHDPQTGWTVFDRRFSFACATTSFAYRYIYDSGSKDYVVRSRLEDTVDISRQNYGQYATDLQLDFAHFPLYLENGICNNFDPAIVQGEISTLSTGGTCGDRVVQAAREDCDPPGSKEYVGICNVQNKINMRQCDANCHWGAAQEVNCATLAVCGNGKKEAGEFCDEGKALNGKYNHCNANCQGFGATGFCGNGVVDGRNEYCDSNTNPAVNNCEFAAGVNVPPGIEEEPIFYFLLDASGSMSNNLDGKKKIDYVKEALPRIARSFASMGATVKFGMLSFTTDGAGRLKITQLLPQNAGSYPVDYFSEAQVTAAMANYVAGGATPTGLAIKWVRENAFNELDPDDLSKPKNLILVTDGDEDASVPAGDKAIDQIPFLFTQNAVKTFIFAVGSTAINFQRWAEAAQTSPFIVINNRGDSIADEVLSIYRKKLCRTYSLSKSFSCAWDCHSFGSYCGDGIVDTVNGEECDGGEDCSIAGVAGKRVCNNKCKFATPAVAWWRFDSADKRKDYSGNKIHALACGNHCPAQRFGKIKASASFNGNQYLIVPNRNDLKTPAFSIEAWINPQEGNGDSSTMLENGYWLHWGPNGQQNLINFSIPGFRGNYSSVSYNLSLDQWSHVVASFDGTYNPASGVSNGKIRLYINGEQKVVSNNLSWLADPNKKMSIGASVGQNGTASHYYKGNIDELAYYNKALTEQEIKDHYQEARGWFCSSTLSVASQPATANKTGCGNNKIEEKEACDRGVNNGIACTPDYNKSCTYCSADCSNVLEVKPAEYCGDSIIQKDKGELCEFDPNNRQTIWSATAGGLAGTAFNAERNGYQVLDCGAASANWPFDIFSGKRDCINNCTGIKDDCVQCGFVSSTNPNYPEAVKVQGKLINALIPDTQNYANVMGIYPANLNLYLYNGDVNTSKLVGLNTMGQSIYDLYSPESPDPALGVMPGQGGPKATLINSAKCVSGGGTVSYKMVLSGGDPADRLDLNHPFDFLVSSQPSPGQYDFVLSPRMSNPAQANHLRVVVVWTAKGAGFDLTDAFGFVKNIPDAQRSTIEQFLTITTGADYYTQVNNPADGIWYHGASNIAGGSFTQSYTIDTSRITHDYAFYVRSDSPISNRDNYIRAEVYFPDTTGVRGTYYTHPAVYYLKDALSSENPAATYWHVFNIMKDGLDMRSRYVLINQKRTSPQYFSFQLPQP